MSKSQDLIEHRIASYLTSTWYARWIIIAIVSSSFLFLPNVKTGIIAALLPSAIIYNFLLIAADKAGWFISNKIFMLIVDGALAVILVVCSGGIASPYLVILPFMIISTAYWYGASAAVAVGLLESSALLIYGILLDTRRGLPGAFIVQMAVFMTIGVYVAWLSESERSERTKLINLGTEAEKERQQLIALVNNMSEAVMVVDPKGIIMMHNQAALGLFTDASTADKKPVGDALTFVDKDEAEVGLKIKQAKPMERKDLRLRAPDGSLMNVSISIAPYIVDRQNRGYVLIIKDITQDKTIDRERQEFISIASHELRTPLSIAQDQLSFLMMPDFLPKDPEALSMLKGATESLKQLSHVISDMTNLWEADHERLPVDIESLNPIDILTQLEADYSDQAKKKGLTLTSKFDPSIGMTAILSSRYVIHEILTIYITNALKFTKEGAVTLCVENREDRPNGVTFSVSDTGLGISKSEQKKVFEKFFQSEEFTTREQGGTGLGLYIARKLADRLTAELWFESELDKGSTFYLWIPPYSKNKKDQTKVAKAEVKDFFSDL